MLAAQLDLAGNAIEASAVRRSAYEHYLEATGKTLDDESVVDFDLLVPYGDR